MKRATLLARLRNMGACDEAVAWLKASDHATLQTAWDACERPDWMLWLLHRLSADRRLMVELACDCAETALPIYAKRYPGDDRPEVCIKTARAWARGQATIEEVQQAKRSCWASYASYAASTAYAAAAAAIAAAYAADAAAYAADAAAYAAARLEARRKMAALIRKRVPNPMEAKP